MISKEKCAKLGLPEPKSFHSQKGFILLCLLHGYKINTRICRYIGIHNLHSILSDLKSRGVPMLITHEQVWCPEQGLKPARPVDVVMMSYSQRKEIMCRLGD